MSGDLLGQIIVGVCTVASALIALVQRRQSKKAQDTVSETVNSAQHTLPDAVWQSASKIISALETQIDDLRHDYKLQYDDWIAERQLLHQEIKDQSTRLDHFYRVFKRLDINFDDKI